MRRAALLQPFVSLRMSSSFKRLIPDVAKRIVWRRRIATELASGAIVAGSPVVLLTHGHTGSTSLGATLRHRLPSDRPLWNIHSLATVDDSPSSGTVGGEDRIGRRQARLSHRVVLEELLGDAFRSSADLVARSTVVFIARDPMSAAVSQLTKALHDGHYRKSHPELYDSDHDSNLVASFIRERLWFHRTLDAWFEENVTAFFDGQIEDFSALRDAPAHVHIGDAEARLVGIRLDRVGETWPAALSETLGTEVLPARRRNVAATKTGDIFSRVSRDLRFPASTVEEAYASRYARSFWSSHEREQMHDRWCD